MQILGVDLMVRIRLESLGVASFCCVVNLMLCQVNKAQCSFQEDREKRTKDPAQKIEEESGHIAHAEHQTKKQS